ncbi:MAG TPA: penicillin-insensitive murein endopeptidase [Polyangiaceae bacterium]
MRRWLFLVSLGTGLCTGCARPSTSEPSQLPLATRAPGPTAVLPIARPSASIESADRSQAAVFPPPVVAVASEASTPAPELSRQQIEERLLAGTLGCLSVGKPNGGALVNGVQLTRSDYFEPVDPKSSWGTDETLAYLEAAARKVHEAFPNSPRLWVGDISREQGGRLSPHRSHQSGRDVDIGYFYEQPGAWYRRATPSNLDLPRTWAFVRALVTETDVEMIFIDHTLSRALWRYAEDLGEDPAWLRRVFATGSGEQPLVRHARGHATHMHVRFRNPRAERLARQAYPVLVKHELVDKVQVYRYHRVQRGETLGKLAKRYGTTVRAIQRANGLRSNVIQAKQSYKIPTSAAPGTTDSVSLVPPRRLPPSEPPPRPAPNPPAAPPTPTPESP